MAGKHRKNGGKAGIAAQIIKAQTSTTDQSKGSTRLSVKGQDWSLSTWITNDLLVTSDPRLSIVVIRMIAMTHTLLTVNGRFPNMHMLTHNNPMESITMTPTLFSVDN